MKEEHDRQMGSPISFDESANIIFERKVVTLCPARADFERVLSINHEKS